MGIGIGKLFGKTGSKTATKTATEAGKKSFKSKAFSFCKSAASQMAIMFVASKALEVIT